MFAGAVAYGDDQVARVNRFVDIVALVYAEGEQRTLIVIRQNAFPELGANHI